MVEVQFEENSQPWSGGFKSPQTFDAPPTSWMFRLLLKLGVTDEKTASYILIGIAVLFFVVSAYFFFFTSTGTSPKAGGAETQQQIELDSLRPR